MTATGERIERVEERHRVIGVVDRAKALANRRPHRLATTVRRTRTAGPSGTGPRAPASRDTSRFGGFAKGISPSKRSMATTFPGRHDAPTGGGVEDDEDHERAAAREPAEGTGRAGSGRARHRVPCAGEPAAPLALSCAGEPPALPCTGEPPALPWSRQPYRRAGREAVVTTGSDPRPGGDRPVRPGHQRRAVGRT